MTLGWEVSILVQEDKFGKDSDWTSTCCPTGMDAVCEMWHWFNTGAGKGALKEFLGPDSDSVVQPVKPLRVSARGTAIGTCFILW